MKTQWILILVLIIGFISCDKEDIVIGNYSGIRVDTYWKDTIVGYGHDTSNITLTLVKSEMNSIININFNPNYSNEDFSFELKDGQFISTTNYHPPILILINDSLYFKHQAGLGPIWTECFTKKTQ